jgi:hypothetical protein
MRSRSPLSNALHQAANHAVPSLFEIDGCGSVSVYPEQDCYVTDIQNWDVACQAQPEQILIKSVAWGLPPSGALPLMELQWRAAYHCALQSQQSEVDVNDLIRLRSWPNLTRLPLELVAPVTQICALLWRKPVVGYLIPRVLDADATQVRALLEVLQGFAHIKVSRTVLGPQPVASPDAGESLLDTGDSRGDYMVQPAVTLVGRLWRRLVGH